MIKLKTVSINKYKSIQKTQIFKIEPDITTLVGMNESGKTSVLTAIAKTNYFNSDKDFEFDITQDYPRKELIDFEHEDEDEDCDIIQCTYIISDELIKEIENGFGKGVFTTKEFSYTCPYKSDKNTFIGINADLNKYLQIKVEEYEITKDIKKKIIDSKHLEDISEIEGTEDDEDLSVFKKRMQEIIDVGYEFTNSLEGYIVKKWIEPKMPKFWYFDDYYPLKGKININELNSNAPKDEKDKTSKALFDLARINTKDILDSTENEYERYIALLEASSNKITNEIFKYWSTNQNLDIEFRIKNISNKQNQTEKVLDIRVKSQRHKISLPLDRRSKGFNWFFSFIIWFSKIQADKKSDYILLLDEPGLNLHASAQADLLRFIEELAKKHQIIFTTHSPFMVDTGYLNRVRTCFETDEGTVISDTIQEKDPNTLFPLQAALGYDIAQNLFVSKNNLLVEGPADLIYLTLFSALLETNGRTGLKEEFTIVPVGGLDKVSTFISLLRGSKLNVVCLLDTFTDQKGKQKVDDLVKYKIIGDKNLHFFDEFANNNYKTADIEDLFTKKDYLKIFNATFKDNYKKVNLKDLDENFKTILKQINKVIGVKRFNHYRPASKLNQLATDIDYFDKKTLENFEDMFKVINKHVG